MSWAQVLSGPRAVFSTLCVGPVPRPLWSLGQVPALTGFQLRWRVEDKDLCGGNQRLVCWSVELEFAGCWHFTGCLDTVPMLSNLCASHWLCGVCGVLQEPVSDLFPVAGRCFSAFLERSEPLLNPV